MVSKRTVGGLLVGVSLAFGGILYATIESLTHKAQVLGCVANTPGCMQATQSLSYSNIAVGFVSAVLSMGVYFLVFHRDTAELLAKERARQRSREEQVELLGKVMAPGERALLSAVMKEDGILQSTLAYRTNLTPGRVSQVLSGFEEQGLVRRTPEGRSFRVHLSF